MFGNFQAIALNCFCTIWVVLKRTFKLFTAVILKRPIEGKCTGSTAAAVWRLLIVEEAEAGLVAADVLAGSGGWRRSS